jgi:integrase
MDDLKKIVKAANQLREIKVYIKRQKIPTSDKAALWIYAQGEKKNINLPTLPINSRTSPEEMAVVREAIEMRNAMEQDGIDNARAMKKSQKKPASLVLDEWIKHYVTDSGKKNAKLAKSKFIWANGDLPVGGVSRRQIIRTMDELKKKGFHSNYIRSVASRLRAFCNWAEQRGYMPRVDTRRLLPAEQFGEVKALSEEELRLLAAAPCGCPDVKDLFMLGVYTTQRVGEIKNYTFQMLKDGEIKARQGKTGKFIKIPLSENALAIMRGLKARREREGKDTGDKAKMFSLPAPARVYEAFKEWLEAAGLQRDRIALCNSRSTSISLLINKGVSQAVAQELANHADTRTTARYYRQLDVGKKREALELIPGF